METIVKNHDTVANALIDNYLSWAQTQPWYGVDNKKLYRELGSDKAAAFNIKHRLVDRILLPEQNHRCCYCMRRITDHSDDASIEHIVPQSTGTQSELQHYFSARSGGLNAANVCLSNDFISKGSLAPPYPHHVAYHNYVIACSACNNKRGNKPIDPLFLFAGIHKEVKYDEYTGEADWLNDPEINSFVPQSSFPSILPQGTLEKVNVNRPILKAIRVVWFYLKRHRLILDSCSRCDLINGALGESLEKNPRMCKDDFRAFLDLDNDGMWEVFKKFDYFGA